MAKAKDFRPQTSPVDTPASPVVTYWADVSGRLVFKNSGGETKLAGNWATGTLASHQIATGGIGTVQTGFLFGQAGVNQTGLGSPNAWLPVIGPNQQRYAIPLYTQS